MSILSLVPKSDPVLKTPTEKFDFTNPPTDPVQLAVDLTETMLHLNGLGLAAPQLGLPYRVFALRSNPVLVCFNPRIVDQSAEEIELEEGCLTFPNLFIKIKRPRIIRVRFTLPNGQTETKKMTDLSARIYQHELDHLDGVLFTSKVSRVKLEMAEKKAKKGR
jgi:peptide deformylase